MRACIRPCVFEFPQPPFEAHVTESCRSRLLVYVEVCMGFIRSVPTIRLCMDFESAPPQQGASGNCRGPPNFNRLYYSMFRW